MATNHGAGVVKLVNTRDLKSLGLGLAGSSPAARTIIAGLVTLMGSIKVLQNHYD